MRLLVAFTIAAVLGCNSGSSNTGNACSDTSNALCAKATSCSAGNDAGVVILFGDGGTGDISFGNTASCELLFALGCDSNDAATSTPAQCSAAVATAQCGSSGQFGPGLLMPDPCNSF